MAFIAPLGFEASPTLPLSVAIAERDLALRFDGADGLLVGDEISLAVGDGEFDHLARSIAAGEGGLRVLDPDMLHLADETQPGVAHQDAGQEAGLAQDLEAVADPEHQAAARRMVRRPPA